jgi:predicted transcriptional regulator
MKQAIHISEAEAVVMEVLWESSPQGADDVVAALAGKQAWQEATIKTLLNRLLNKGAISAEKSARRYLYATLLTREQWLQQESDNFLDRLFGGSLAPLLTHFSKQRKLDAEEISALKKLIEGLDDER